MAEVENLRKENKQFPPSWIIADGKKVLNVAWLDHAFEMHAAYILQVEKIILEARGQNKLVFVPHGPAQRRVVYTVCGTALLSHFDSSLLLSTVYHAFTRFSSSWPLHRVLPDPVYQGRSGTEGSCI